MYTNDKMMQMYLDSSRMKSPSILKIHEAVMAKFTNDVNKGFCDVSTGDIRAWLMEYKKTLKPGVVESYRLALLSVFGWLYEVNLIPCNPMKGVKPIRDKKRVDPARDRIRVQFISNVSLDSYRKVQY